MPGRTPAVGGNWKMNLDRAAGVALAEAVAAACRQLEGPCDVSIHPPFPYLDAVARTLGADAPVALGAQDVFDRPDGAFTGEVSTAMLRDLGVAVVIVGHSERRHVIGETDAIVNAKLRAALDAGLAVILCVGETIDQREAGTTEAIVTAQLDAGLAHVDAGVMDRVIVAYEPVWAIGTGRTASPADAEQVHAAIRARVRTLFDDATADGLRIQYGGSVKPDNAAALIAETNIDGFLVGGAALDADAFRTILTAAARASAATVAER